MVCQNENDWSWIWDLVEKTNQGSHQATSADDEPPQVEANHGDASHLTRFVSIDDITSV
jgi:hypothetical protein